MATGLLHQHAASTALLRRVGVFASWDSAPDRGNHVISGAVAVGDDALGSVADGNPFPLEVLAQPVVQLGEPPQLQISHRLLVLLNLRRIANIAGGVLRHCGGGGSGSVILGRLGAGRERWRGWRMRRGRRGGSGD